MQLFVYIYFVLRVVSRQLRAVLAAINFARPVRVCLCMRIELEVAKSIELIESNLIERLDANAAKSNLLIIAAA